MTEHNTPGNWPFIFWTGSSRNATYADDIDKAVGKRIAEYRGASDE